MKILPEKFLETLEIEIMAVIKFIYDLNGGCCKECVKFNCERPHSARVETIPNRPLRCTCKITV